MTRFIIEKDVKVSRQNKKGETLLHRAALEGKLEVAGFLIQQGADINKQCKSGFTPLHDALARDRLEVASFLIERPIFIINGIIKPWAT